MELRKDYILDRWVIIADNRRKRPHEFKPETKANSPATDFFAPGNEHLTPPEKGHIGEPWQIRWFDNIFPFVAPQGNPIIQTHNEFFTFGSPFGIHEIIVETPSSEKQMWDLSVEELALIFRVYMQRISELSTMPEVKWVGVFKNHGKEAGASILHSHSQVVAVNIEPPTINAEIDACAKYGGQPYTRILNIEKTSYRRVKETDTAVSFTPYASRFNYELWIFPKREVRMLAELSDQELRELVIHVHDALQTLKKLDLPFNMVLHYPPKGKDLHLHIEILPHGSTWAGFEYETNIIINTVSPEFAAQVYRGEINDPNSA